MPRFSIGIPTYNRAHLIGRSIESALAQTHPEVEVIVCDNASTDRTEEVVRAYGDRVRYHRNPTNIGMWPNFALVPELANGDYFAWLQDDDFLHRDFALKADRALSAAEDILLYVCWVAYSPSPESLPKWTSIHGPALSVDWLGSEPAVVDGLVLVPFSFFESQALPPAVAFRTPAVRLGVRDFLDDCFMYNEQVVVASVGARGKAAIDPWIGGIQIYHQTQSHLVFGGDPVALLNQKLSHARYTDRLLNGLPGRWRDLFREALGKLATEYRSRLVENVVHDHDTHPGLWAASPPMVLEIRDMVVETLPEPERERLRALFAPPGRGPKDQLRRVVPPRFWKTLRAARVAWNHGGT